MNESDDAPVRVRESTLPGIGKKYVMPLRAGGHLAVLVRPDGDRQIFHFLEDDDRPCDAVRLERDEAQQLANFMGSAMVGAPDTDQLELVLGSLEIEWVELDASSPLVGRTLAESELRRRTGASVVAVLRGDRAIPNPSIDTRFEAHDTLLLIGSDTQTDRARNLLERGPERPA